MSEAKRMTGAERVRRGWTVERATPADAAEIARLVRASLPARLRPLTIWASPRVDRYVESILTRAFSNEAHEYYLLRNHRVPATGLPADSQVVLPTVPATDFAADSNVVVATRPATGLAANSTARSTTRPATGFAAGSTARSTTHPAAALAAASAAGLPTRPAAGLAAFRRVEGEAFLNHLYVAAPFRGRALGALLLERAARDYLARHPAARLALDVFSHNTLAAKWYARLGFKERARQAWCLRRHIRQGPRASSRPTFIEGLSGADRGPRAWGFSSFVVRLSAGRRYRVGRLYKPYFRLAGAPAGRDVELHRALAALDPARRLVLHAPDDFAEPSWRRVALSFRLECPARLLLSRLAASEPGASLRES